jgi:hypothetical protein
VGVRRAREQHLVGERQQAWRLVQQRPHPAFLNYNIKEGLYLTSSPILTVDWKADSGQRWTVPIGGGVGKIFHFGRLPVHTQLSGYYNVVRPDFGANWQIRAQVQLMFPK